MNFQETIKSILQQLASALENLNDEHYTQKCKVLSQTSIGQHVRHVIELFQCLETGFITGTVNYENRQRNSLIETNKGYALQLIEEISGNLKFENKDLKLEATYYEDKNIIINTNYFRELAYNLEHTIHHMALIRIGIENVSTIILPAEFGVAPSTTKYRKQCAQ